MIFQRIQEATELMLMTTAKAAERLECTLVTIVKAVKQGRLTAHKIGRDWMIIEDEKFKKLALEKPERPPNQC